MPDTAQIGKRPAPRAEICSKCGGKVGHDPKDGGCVCATTTCSGNR